jgi:hypothetical protein
MGRHSRWEQDGVPPGGSGRPWDPGPPPNGFLSAHPMTSLRYVLTGRWEAQVQPMPRPSASWTSPPGVPQTDASTATWQKWPRRHPWLTGIVILVVLLWIIGVAMISNATAVDPNSPAGRIQTGLVGTVAHDGTTITSARCDPSTVRTWGDGSISATCYDTFADGSTATQFAELLGSSIEDLATGQYSGQ